MVMHLCQHADGSDSDFAYHSVEDEDPAYLKNLLAASRAAIGWLDLSERIAGVGHWRIALPDQAVSWSNEACRILGVTPETCIPDYPTLIGFCHPDDREVLVGLIRCAAQQGAAFDTLLRLLPRGSQPRTMRCRGRIVADDAGATVAVFGVFIDVTEQQRTEQDLRAANRQLDEIAHLDALTGLSNRRRFDEALEREWHAAARAGTALSVVTIDVDRFKSYNDTFGHQDGDTCLRVVSATIRSVLRRGTCQRL